MKKYIFYCINQLIDQYYLSPPFLDIGSGIGDISQYVASKGWYGKAIDFSDIAIEKTKQNLAMFRDVGTEKKSLFQETGTFKTIFLLDVLEHVENDNAALKKISSLLTVGGHALIGVPSNPKEWRWDDDYYGHYRRYTAEEIKKKSMDANLKPLVCWDFTYPVFWMMRRIYTRLKSFPKNIDQDKHLRTTVSSSANAWDIPLFSNFLSQDSIFWRAVYNIQFAFFRDDVHKGHEMIVLTKRTA